MRRPHPRFDERRNAWVTRAGGSLKILAPGPKSSITEAAAWDAFYVHMTRLGQPLAPAPEQTLTVGELADRFAEWMRREIETGRMKQGTYAYYCRVLQKFIDAVGGRRPALSVSPHEVEMYKTGWHSVQAVQRLYNWGVQMGLVEKNPFSRIVKPPLGARERILTPRETSTLIRASDRHFRPFLFALRHTIARPQEIRALKWENFVAAPDPVFVLREFKAKARRKDKAAVRIIPLDDRMLRLLERLARRYGKEPKSFVFQNSKGLQWSSNAVRCRMRRLREKLRLGRDENGEQVVAYTLRHTSATNASANGVRDRVLAELMGHTNTRTTQRYQHLQTMHLSEAIRKVNAKFGDRSMS